MNLYLFKSIVKLKSDPLVIKLYYIKWGSDQMQQPDLTCEEYLALSRPASQLLSQTRVRLSLSRSLFSLSQDSLASRTFFSHSTRRRSISFLRFRLASMASLSRPFLVTLTNSSSCQRQSALLIMDNMWSNLKITFMNYSVLYY